MPPVADSGRSASTVAFAGRPGRSADGRITSLIRRGRLLTPGYSEPETSRVFLCSTRGPRRTQPFRLGPRGEHPELETRRESRETREWLENQAGNAVGREQSLSAVSVKPWVRSSATRRTNSPSGIRTNDPRLNSRPVPPHLHAVAPVGLASPLTASTCGRHCAVGRSFRRLNSGPFRVIFP